MQFCSEYKKILQFDLFGCEDLFVGLARRGHILSIS